MDQFKHSHHSHLFSAVAHDLQMAWLLGSGRSPMEAAVSLALKHNNEVDMVAMRDGHQVPVTVLTDPGAIHYVLHNKSGQYTDKPTIRHLSGVVDQGVVMANGHSWEGLRKDFIPSFGNLRHRPAILQRMIEATEEMFGRWQEKANPDKSINLDFSDEFRRLPSDIFLRTLFGMKGNEKTREMQADVQAIFHGIVHSLANPIGSAVAKLLHHAPYDGKLDRIRALANEIIEDRRRELANGLAGEDLLSHMVRTLKPPEHGPDVLMHNFLTLFAAGYETTSTAFIFAAKELTEHPDVWEKIVQEVDEKLGGNLPNSLDDLHKLTYLQAAVKEVFRLHPPLSFMIRQAANDDRIPHSDGTFHDVKKGEVIVISADAVHRDPKNFLRPDKLLPGRYSAGDPDYIPHNERETSTFLTFGGGIRGCLGQPLATFEVTLVLAMMAQRYNFKVQNPEKIHMRFDLTSHPDREAMAVVTPRALPAPAA